MIQEGIWILVGLSIVIFYYVYCIRKELGVPSSFYLHVYLVLRSKEDPTDTGKQWLLEKFCSFRIVPRVGDTLLLENGQYPVVTEVQLRTDKTCTVWCDIDIPEAELEKTAAEYLKSKGWTTETPDPKFHHLVKGGGKLSWRSGTGFGTNASVSDKTHVDTERKRPE